MRSWFFVANVCYGFIILSCRVETHHSILDGFITGWVVNLTPPAVFCDSQGGIFRIIILRSQSLRYFRSFWWPFRILSWVNSFRHFDTSWDLRFVSNLFAYNLTLLLTSFSINEIADKNTLLLLVLSLRQFEGFCKTVWWIICHFGNAPRFLNHHLFTSIFNELSFLLRFRLCLLNLNSEFIYMMLRNRLWLLDLLSG